MDLHKRNGAVVVERDGWLLVDHFGDSDNEYSAVKTDAGLIDLSHRAMLQFTGPDRLSFLQGMLSNDLRPLKMFEGIQAAILTQQGKIVADVRVLCAMNSFYLDFWEFLKEKVVAHLNHYLVADEVEINDPDEQWKILSLQGPQATDRVKALFSGADLPSKIHHHGMVQWDGAPICVVKADHTGVGGYDLVVQTAQLPKFAERLHALNLKWIGERAQNILRVEAGIPRYGIDMTEDNLLLEANLENAVSFTKGCYLGQEVVERIRSRGHVNKKLLGLLIAGNAAVHPDSMIQSDGREIGQITSSVVSPALHRPIALGYMHRDFWTPGLEVSVDDNGTLVPATIAELPFIKPGS